MTKKADQRLLDGQAWEGFCDQLKAAGRIVEKFGEQASDLDRAEWYCFFSRLTRNGFERFVERFVESCKPSARD